MSYLYIGLNNNQEYKSLMEEALQKATAKKQNYIFEKTNDTENTKKLAWIEEGEKYNFLFFMDTFTFSICYEEKVSKIKEAFSYHKNELGKNEFLPNIVLKGIFFSKYNKMQVPDQKEFIEKYFKFYLHDSTGQKEIFNEFHNHLFEKNYLSKPITEDILNASNEALVQTKHMKFVSKEIVKGLKKLKSSITELNIKKHIFNDLDAGFGLSNLENAICFKSQGISFIAVASNEEKDWDVYHFNTETNKSTYKTQAKIEKAIKSGIMEKKDIVLSVKNNKPTYMGNYVECMRQDVEFSLEEIEDIKNHAKKKLKKM